MVLPSHNEMRRAVVRDELRLIGGRTRSYVPGPEREHRVGRFIGAQLARLTMGRRSRSGVVLFDEALREPQR